MGFTREAESPCPRVEGPTPQLAKKRSLVPGVLFFFAGTRRSLVPHTKTKTIFFHTKTNISRTHTRTDFFGGMYQVSIRNSLRSNISSPLQSKYQVSHLENASNIHQKIPVVAKCRIAGRLRKQVCMLILRLYMSSDELPSDIIESSRSEERFKT